MSDGYYKTRSRPLPDSRKSMVDKVAWFVLLIPPASVVVAYIALTIAGHLQLKGREQDDVETIIIISALFAQSVNLVIGLLTGLLICLGSHTRKLTIWIALAGVLATLVFGALTFFAYLLTGLGKNC